MEMNHQEHPILKVKNLKKSFGENTVHKDITFELFKGECVGLLGPSGTGKSVLLRSIIGLEYIDEGKIIFKDKEIQDLGEKELFKIRTQISYSFQSGALFDSLNVFENIAYPLFEHSKLSFKEIEKKVHDMLKLIDLKDKENLMPADLSGGMQKRVGMARSIVLEPEIVLYDEPTAGLDPINTVNVVDLMKKLKSRGFSSIFVTHDIPSALQLCDRILMIEKGIVVFNDSTENFIHSQNSSVQNFLVNSGIHHEVNR
jgi:phospholipid/cholesterol/gamma-HCH transport system ATP-binding protein